MKISKIKIAGFRGIPPVDPADVEIDLKDKNNELKNLLIYAPNAYGKSSIADAFEWFFRGQVRGNEYCCNYKKENNVHLFLGESGFLQNGYIELDINKNGTTYTARKEFDKNGDLISENLGNISNDIAECVDEIVVLDHDKFRKFVTDANSEKFSTFSSLIGYQELDMFRSGIDFISQTALNNFLQIPSLDSQIHDLNKEINSLFHQACIDLEIKETNEITMVEDAFVNKLTIFLSIFSQIENNSTLNFFNNYDWSQIKNIVDSIKETNLNNKEVINLNNLEESKNYWSPLREDELQKIEKLLQKISEFDVNKELFEQQVLQSIYKSGLYIINKKDKDTTKCPLCGTEFLKKDLVASIKSRIESTTLENLMVSTDYIQTIAVEVKLISDSLIQRTKKIQTEKCKTFSEKIINHQKSLDFSSIENIDVNKSIKWIESIKIFNTYLSEEYEKISLEVEKNKNILQNQRVSDYSIKFNNYSLIRQNIINLQEKLSKFKKINKELDIKKSIIDIFRKSAKGFRDELSDFSGYVASLLNNDIKKYYSELHPDDEIKPSLQVNVSGTTRSVQLICDFNGKTNVDASSLLSESHRNSLGLAIFLAFQKFKHSIQPGINFIVFDDVTQSFDTEHRTNLINLLENMAFPEVKDKQILFFTHDSTLADLIKKQGENDLRPNWIRMDIKNWWIKRMLMKESPNPLQTAADHIQNSDVIAAAVYIRQALEKTYKLILKKYKLNVPYFDNSTDFSLDKMRKVIIEQITDYANLNIGLINPNDPRFQLAFMSQRILNYTVHDSSFLDNPIALGDVKCALKIVQDLDTMFKCKNCHTYFHVIKHTHNPPNNANQINCKNCHQPIP